MTQRSGTPRRSSVRDAETGSGARQVPARPHDSGSQANETVDGLDAITEALRSPENLSEGVMAKKQQIRSLKHRPKRGRRNRAYPCWRF